jgi:gliding motility-associated-like protein
MSGSSSTPNVTFAWTDALGNPAGTTPSQTSTTVTTAGTYTLTITDNNSGCTSVGNVTVVLDNNAPTVSIATPSLMSCALDPVTLTGSSSASNASYSWTNASGNPAGTTPSAATTDVNALGTYTLTVVDLDNGCTNTTTVDVISENAPLAAIASAQELTCNVPSIGLDASGSEAGVDITYAWSGPGIVSGANSVNPVINQPGTYTLTVTNTTTGCSSTATVNVTQNTTNPFADAQASSSINCTTTTVSLDGTSSTGNNLSYAWTGPNIISGNNASTASAGLAGWYILEVTDAANGCSDIDSVEVLLDTIAPTLTTANNAEIGCNANDVNLTTSGNASSFLWTGPRIVGSTTNSAVLVNAAGTYIVTAIGSNGCTSTDTVQVSQVQGPTADFTITPNQGNATLVSTTNNTSTGNGLSYFWNLGNGATSTSENTSGSYDVPGTYTVTLIVTDSLGCTDTTTRSVIVDGTPVDVPNGFTPNGDGFNDYFVIVGLNQYPENKITIFNRWGDPVFSASPYQNNWDGTSNNEKLRVSGDKVVDGTYFFILELGEGIAPITGYVELKTR